MHNHTLAPAELQRYARHLTLPDFGLAGQERLKRSSALVIGAGGLGSPLALYLAAAGIGRIGLVDDDAVDASNLQRQILHGTAALGVPKVVSAAARLRDLNPYVEISTHQVRISSANALELIAPYDIVIDGTDNFPTRYLTNDACVMLGKPNVYGAIYRFEGQISVFDPARGGPCYRCLYPTPPPPGLVPSCAEGGVLGVLPGVVGAIQATEAIKLLTGMGTSLMGRLLLYDALHLSFQELRVKRAPSCPVCGPNPSVTALIDYEQFCGLKPAGAPAVQELSPADVAAWLQRPDKPQFVDVREADEWHIGHVVGATHIPLAQLLARQTELNANAPVVVICRSGARSARACAQLQDAGFTHVWNVAGGAQRWAREVDPTLVVA